MFPIPVPVNASAAGVTPASHTDRSQTADAEGEGEATEFAEGGEEDVADEGGNENEMAMAEDEYGYDDSGYLEACEQDERRVAILSVRILIDVVLPQRKSGGCLSSGLSEVAPRREEGASCCKRPIRRETIGSREEEG